jgi:hypothetical protein
MFPLFYREKVLTLIPFFGVTIALGRITTSTGRHNVANTIRAAFYQRNEMIESDRVANRTVSAAIVKFLPSQDFFLATPSNMMIVGKNFLLSYSDFYCNLAFVVLIVGSTLLPHQFWVLSLIAVFLGQFNRFVSAIVIFVVIRIAIEVSTLSRSSFVSIVPLPHLEVRLSFFVSLASRFMDRSSALKALVAAQQSNALTIAPIMQIYTKLSQLVAIFLYFDLRERAISVAHWFRLLLRLPNFNAARQAMLVGSVA